MRMQFIWSSTSLNIVIVYHSLSKFITVMIVVFSLVFIEDILLVLGHFDDRRYLSILLSPLTKLPFCLSLYMPLCAVCLLFLDFFYLLQGASLIIHLCLRPRRFHVHALTDAKYAPEVAIELLASSNFE